MIEVRVTGARNDEDARRVAKSVASSSLTKAAVFGKDPNWGRIACAAGYSGAHFDVNDLAITLGDRTKTNAEGATGEIIALMEKGQPLDFDAKEASGYLGREKDRRGVVHINLAVGAGDGQATAWGCDLSYDYVKINAEYTT